MKIKSDILLNFIDLFIIFSHRLGENCLLSLGGHDNSSYNTDAMSTQPGQRYSPDMQCHFLYGANSFYCGVSLIFYKTIMWELITNEGFHTRFVYRQGMWL